MTRWCWSPATSGTRERRDEATGVDGAVAVACGTPPSTARPVAGPGGGGGGQRWLAAELAAMGSGPGRRRRGRPGPAPRGAPARRAALGRGARGLGRAGRRRCDVVGGGAAWCRGEPAAADRRAPALHGPGAAGGEARRTRPPVAAPGPWRRSEEHTSELQSLAYLVCRLLLEKKKKIRKHKQQA